MAAGRTGNGPAAKTAVSAFAPAKVNLYLHVLGRRPDGYHELDSLVVFAGVGDRLSAEPADGLALTVEGPFAALVPTGEDNLVLRAARAVAEATGVPARAAIHLDKRLPAAAGIGGGSADAAAAIRMLCRLWQVNPTAKTLHALALGLGADVPVCLSAQPAYFGGIGEIIDPAPLLPPAWLVLVNPLQGAPTPRVFAARQGPFATAGRLAETPQDAVALARVLAERHNGLTVAAKIVTPAVGGVIEALEALPEALLVRMSGSGATVFALFAAAEAAQAAAAQLSAARPDWWVAAAPLLRDVPDEGGGKGQWTSTTSGSI